MAITVTPSASRISPCPNSPCRGRQVNASAVQDALWNGRAVQGKTVWNLVGRTRTALGTLPDGTWALPPADGTRRMKGLDPAVTTDLAILRYLYEQAQNGSSSEAIGSLREALASTPRLTQDWFRNELSARVGLIGLTVVVAMMLASAIQAAPAGRPEQIGDAVKEGARAIVASALTVTAIDVLIGVTDEASAAVWQVGRGDLVAMIEGMVVVATTTGPLGATFVGPLCLLFGFIGLIGLVVALMMRSALIWRC